MSSHKSRFLSPSNRNSLLVPSQSTYLYFPFQPCRPPAFWHFSNFNEARSFATPTGSHRDAVPLFTRTLTHPAILYTTCLRRMTGISSRLIPPIIPISVGAGQCIAAYLTQRQRLQGRVRSQPHLCIFPVPVISVLPPSGRAPAC